MELLSELIYVLEQNSTYALNEFLPGKSKMKKLFILVRRGKVQTDDEAAGIIYKGSGKDKKFLMLKRNLVKTLSEIVFKANSLSHHNLSWNRLRFVARKELMIADKLLQQNVYHNAEKIVLKVKAHAEKYFFTELQIDCWKHLRTINTLKGFPREVEICNEMLNRLNTNHFYEQEAAGFIALLESKTKFIVGKYQEISGEADRYLTKVKIWRAESGNPELSLCQYRLEIIRCYHLNHIPEWKLALEELSLLLDNSPILRTEALSLFMDVEWIKYLRCTGQLSEANAHLERALGRSDYAAFNRFEVQALNFDIKIKERKYDEAGKILLEVSRSKQFSLLQVRDHAAWHLREAYLRFIFLSLGDKSSLERYAICFTRNFSVAILAETCKAISKDKRGYNFMLMILKEAFMRHRYPGEPGTQGNAMLVYYQRYLKDSSEARSRLFLKSFARASSGGPDGRLLPKGYDAGELIPFGDLRELLLEAVRDKE